MLDKLYGIWHTNRAMLVRYVLIGFSAYGIEMTTLWFGHSKLHLSDEAAVTLSFWISLVCAFALQKVITFRNRQSSAKHLASQTIKYACLVLWNYVFSTFSVHILTGRLSVYVIRTGTIAVITSWNFFIYKKLFHEPLPEELA